MRCKACDTPMKENEIIWREEIKEHEELCLLCRQAALGFEVEALEYVDKLDDPHEVISDG